MSRPDKVYARFRGVVKSDTAIAGVFGPTGAEDLAFVKVDAGGELVLAGQGEALGVIMTTEGKADSGVANFYTAAAGSVVTVFTSAEFLDCGFTVGDEIWSAAAGDAAIAATAVPTQKVGFTVLNDPAKGDHRVVFNIAAASDIT
jgi:hypothetical protein